jgi:hypothetical protein
MLSPYRHAAGRKALTAALRGRSWIDAHDTPTPTPIAAACRSALSPGAALCLDEQDSLERETTLSAIRGALAASSPDALALIEQRLTRDSMPPPSPVPPLQRRRRYR